MATPTIPNGEEYFFPIIYEGNGAGQRVGKFVPFTDNGTIDNSCLFENNVSSYLSRTLSSNGSGTTVTFSCWVKRDILAQGLIGSVIMMHSNISSNSEILSFDSSDRLHYYEVTSGSRKWNYISNRTFEDTSKWYHILVSRDTTNATQADRVKIYVDGERITSWNTETQPALNATGYWNQTTYDAVVGNTNSGSYIDGAGYLAEVNMVDGTALGPSTFGVTDTSTGRWIPKTLSGITYGTNGFRLKFQDSSALGDDTSGNTNDFTATNLASTDQTTDSPTQNHTTLNPLKNSNITLSEGNLKAATVSGAQGYASGSQIPLTSGKYYSEITITTAGPTLFFLGVGNFNDYIDHYTEDNPISRIAGGYIRSDTGQAYTSHNDVGTYHTYGNSFTTSDVIGIAIDVDKGAMWISKNGTWQNSATASEIADGDTSNSLRTGMKGPLIILNNTHSGTTIDYNFGQRSFSYTAPTGYNSIQQDNLPETAKGISGLVWAKSRDSASLPHQLVDSSRGVGNRLISSSTAAEAFNSNHLSRFLKGGYATGDINVLNTAGDSMVAWNWVADSGTTSTNTDGSITSTVQANTTAGFSIVEYTGTGSNATVGHGLSTAPKWIWVKQLNSTGHFSVYLGVLGGTKISYTSTSVVNSPNSTYWNNTDATSSVFSVGTNADVNGSSSTYVAYCWSEIDGYSRFGSYTGNGNADGPFVYTGFKPAWVMIKNAGATASWFMLDGKRNTFNPTENWLVADDPQAEVVTAGDRKIDFLSNGFKVRATTTDFNGSSANMIYMAFAEHPFVGDGTNPVTAR